MLTNAVSGTGVRFTEPIVKDYTIRQFVDDAARDLRDS